ncbi:MAG TPA: arylamine N-acetyltransferase [Methylophilaceae bacterium]|nr:arylamine N-acetyltransferase [Methylophilaceae bacterium]
MESLDSLFRSRIGFNRRGALRFDDLPALLAATSLAFPFENLAIVERRGLPISRENLITKLLIRNEGGLCYELNPLLYFFLLENEFDVTMVRGIVYNPELGAFVGTGHTHVTILLRHQGMTYVVDTGFGIFLPLHPVSLKGNLVSSHNGEFRVRPAIGENAVHGDFVFELKQRYKDPDWRIGYVFDSRHAITTTECEEIRQIIAGHSASPFNKRPLVAKLTERGSITLTNMSLIITEDGNVSKEPVRPEQLRDLLALHFKLTLPSHSNARLAENPSSP